MNPNHIVSAHGYSVLFLWVLAEQAGLPIPAVPILLAMGAMSAEGHVSLGISLVLATIASVLADIAWYFLGRGFGMRVLNLLCRVSIEPSTCVRQTELAFSKQGLRSLLIAKFVPGLGTAAPPLAGVFHFRFSRFLLYDAAGTFLWAGGYLALGVIFHAQLEVLERGLSQLAGSLFSAALIGLALYVVWKLIARELFIQKLRMSRIAPWELKHLLDSGEKIVIVDLRHGVEFDSDPSWIAGAIRISPEELNEKHEQIPRDQDVILYCT